MCMALYLFAASAVTMAHAYLTNAVQGALRLNLHQTNPLSHPVEQTARKKTYRFLRALHIYTSSFLGLPCTLPLSDMDKSLTTGISSHESDGPARWEEMAVEANSKLLEILGSSLQEVYFNGQGTTVGSIYRVPCNILRECGDFIEQWYRSSTALLQDDDDAAQGPRAKYPRHSGEQNTKRLTFSWQITAHC